MHLPAKKKTAAPNSGEPSEKDERDSLSDTSDKECAYTTRGAHMTRHQSPARGPGRLGNDFWRVHISLTAETGPGYRKHD